MVDKFESGLIGVIIGVVGTAGGLILGASPNVDEARVFQREKGKPAVMRMYKPGRDGIFVQDMENEGKYIRLSNYLDNIQNKADREIEEATIKKVVEWYK